MTKLAKFALKIRRFENRGECVEALGETIVRDLGDGIARRDAASLVVSGGTTPGPLFDTLSQAPLSWENVTVTLTDERWVAPSDARSNENLVRERLLKDRAARARFVPLKSMHSSPVEAEDAIDKSIAAVVQPFDVTLLGMGADGHMASLLPGAAELPAALDASSPKLVRAIAPGDAERLGLRMSLSLRAILNSRRIAIFICGDEKTRALETALGASDAMAMPIRAVLHQDRVPVEVYWAP